MERLTIVKVGGKVVEDKSSLEARCKHISERERAAMSAERESIKYKQMEYLKNKVGQEFSGVISGVIESGIFVELEDSRAEGMISFRNMQGFSMTAPYTAGSRTGEKYTIGQKVNVRIVKIDLSARQMDLAMAGDEDMPVNDKPVRSRSESDRSRKAPERSRQAPGRSRETTKRSGKAPARGGRKKPG